MTAVHPHVAGEAVSALLEDGLVSAEQVRAAEQAAKERGLTTLEVLLESGYVDRGSVLRLAASAAGMAYVDVTELTVDPAAASVIPAEFARRNAVLPLGWEDGELVVAVAIRRAGDIELKDDLSRLTRGRVRFAIANKADIEAKVNQVYRHMGELDDLTSGLETEVQPDEDLASFTAVSDEAPIVRFVNLLIAQAISDRASDIHIEPGERELRVRYRIDGVLHDAHHSPKSVQAGVLSRLKIMAELDIAERRVPQDGRLTVTHQGRRVDLRIATLPTVWGEKVVARILDTGATRLELDDLGFSADNLERFRESFTKPYGMILATGPTGSGKSTTLYAALNQLNRPEVNIITVEDPVEYRLAGVNQVQVHPRAGLTFASALRSILRADPDVILVGEIRDHETAQIAVESALTGHLVLSTLHTNDAASAVTRLVEMGIEPYLVGSALDAVLAQRLCRSLCERCRQAYEPDPIDLLRVRFPWHEDEPLPVLYQPVGCSSCANTGYRGRLALHEVMPVTEGIERLAVAQASTEEVSRFAQQQGMRTLRDDGWLKVLDGRTSLQEVLRVVV